MQWQLFVMISAIAYITDVLSASVTTYTNKDAWQSAIPDYSVIDFEGFPHGTPLTSQYAESHGVTFAAGNWVNNPDGIHVGLRGQPGSRLYFESPQQWVAVDFPGQILFKLYFDGEVIYESLPFWSHNSPFAGIISETPFDEVYFYRTTSSLVFYDNLYFGVPSPGALSVFALAAFGCRRRRR
ncbi:MAG TPA: hypothetical protein PK400_12650 [Phycisphaerales bacterium]|nr:hypothetical protein [Phycisphaerales bacterium]HRQ76946.1 hypothetical protein [Phycisphaerales bacterium]